jgi:toxin ParE1/3/4
VPQYQLTPAAERDLRDILRETRRRFGTLQQKRYARLIEHAIALVAAEPHRPGSRPRNELTAGLRSFHIELAARRRGAASHVLYYVLGMLRDGSEGVIIARVLHEAMDPGRHLPPAW